MIQQQQQPAYGAPLAPPQTHIQVVSTPTQNNINKGVMVVAQQLPQGNIVVKDLNGSIGQVNQHNSFKQNVISPATFVQAHSYSRPQSRQQAQPLQTNTLQQVPITLQRTSVRQEDAAIIRSPKQQPQIIVQQQPLQQQTRQIIVQAQPEPQQVILQTKPQQAVVHTQPQPQQHQIIVQAAQPQKQVIIQQQQPQVQQHTQQTHHQLVNVHQQPQPMTPIVSVAPVSLNLPEETGGIFQLAHVRPELYQSPVERVHRSSSAHANPVQYFSARIPEVPAPKVVHPAGSSLVARTILGQDDDPIEKAFHQHVNQMQFQSTVQQQQQQVRVVRDEQEVFELKEKIKILLDNLQELNKTIDYKEQETQDLYTRLLELEHLRRTKALVDEENEALKLQIQEWQKRFNVLELQHYEKLNVNGYAYGTTYGTHDNQNLLNTLKIKQEENEALKTTITRLELNQTSQRNLKEEIHRLNDLVSLKTSQCEEWKNKYLNLEQTHFQSMSFNPLKYTQQYNYENTSINGIASPSSIEHTQQRGRSPVAYETSALFKKKNEETLNINNYQISNPLQPNGITSYLEDYKSNKIA